MLNTCTIPTCTTCISRFWICLGYLFRRTATLPVTFRCHRTSLSHPLPTSSPSAVHCTPGCCQNPPPASFLRLSLRFAPRACVYCHFCVRPLPPLPPSACNQVPVVPWGLTLDRSLRALGLIVTLCVCLTKVYLKSYKERVFHPCLHPHLSNMFLFLFVHDRRERIYCTNPNKVLSGFEIEETEYIKATTLQY